MKSIYKSFSVILSGFAMTSAFSQAIPGPWKLTYANEFDKGTGGLKGWTFELGNNGGWGNNEKEVYTNSPKNASIEVDADGKKSLHINLIATGTGADQTYTSARVTSTKFFSQAYGLFEFRAKLPAGQGLWPALWLMPEGQTYGGWPTSGEIDILESRGQTPGLVQGSLHSGDSWQSHDTQTKIFSETGLEPAGFSTNDWHTYDLEWIPGTSSKPATIKYYVDGINYYTASGGWVVPKAVRSSKLSAPFDKPFYIIMNLAVGGGYGGEVNLEPGTYSLEVAYIHVYKAKSKVSESDDMKNLNSLFLAPFRK